MLRLALEDAIGTRARVFELTGGKQHVARFDLHIEVVGQQVGGADDLTVRAIEVVHLQVGFRQAVSRVPELWIELDGAAVLDRRLGVLGLLEEGVCARDGLVGGLARILRAADRENKCGQCAKNGNVCAAHKFPLYRVFLKRTATCGGSNWSAIQRHRARYVVRPKIVHYLAKSPEVCPGGDKRDVVSGFVSRTGPSTYD